MNISLNREMSTTTPIKNRGKKALYLWNGKDTSITELLTEPDVREFVSQGSTMTYESQRGRLRKLFKDGKITPKLVEEYVKKNPVRQYNVPDTLYGAQRRRANLHKKTKRGEVIYGPLLPLKPKKELRSIINGKHFTAREALDYYPRLRELLQNGKSIKERTLQSKLRRWFRKGKVPGDVTDEALEIIKSKGLSNEVLGEHKILAKVNTSPADFLDTTRTLTTNFLRDHPQNKIRISLVCTMMRVDPATGLITNEENAVFKSNQESVFETSDIEALYIQEDDHQGFRVFCELPKKW